MPGQPTLPQPKRGEIWFVKFPSDPPEKNPRPVVIVSVDARNQHPRAETVLVAPLSTTLRDSPTHIRLQPGETGLAEACDIQAENISTIRKQTLQASRNALRRIGESALREIARSVVRAMGFVPTDLGR
jgi:mRNA interferase MazF